MIASAADGRTGQRELERELRRFVGRRVAQAHDVDDVVQDVFVRLHRGQDGLRDEERFGAWVVRVARSAIAEHGRKRARHPLVGDDAADVEASVGAEVSEDGSGDESEAIERELARCVPVFVAMLPSPYREALTLTELEGMSQKDAAELVGVSWSGMKSRVQRGRQQLRELFDDCCAIALDARGRVMTCEPRPGWRTRGC